MGLFGAGVPAGAASAVFRDTTSVKGWTGFQFLYFKSGRSQTLLDFGTEFRPELESDLERTCFWITQQYTGVIWTSLNPMVSNDNIGFNCPMTPLDSMTPLNPVVSNDSK